MSNLKEFSTYTIESPLVTCGKFTDSKGRNLEITKDTARDIYNNLTGVAPLKDIHIDGESIGSIQKYVLKDDGIYQKSVITDVQKFESRYGNGHVYISPEIETEADDHGNVISAKLTGAALTNNPGMVQIPIMVSKHYFEAPTEPAKSNDWNEPLGELKSTISNLNNTLSTFGDKVKGMNETVTTQSTAAQTPSDSTPVSSNNTMTLSVDDLAELVNDAVEKRVASMQSPKNPEASETASSPDAPTNDDDLKKFGEMAAELDNLKKTQEKAFLKQFNTLVTEMKGLGIEHPEKMAPDGLSTEQKITILESIKENFAKKSPMSAPLQEPLAGSQSGGKKPNTITVDDVLSVWDTEYGSSNSEYGSIRYDTAIRNKLSRLSDTDLMMRYNLPVLYNANGEYIGPL